MRRFVCVQMGRPRAKELRNELSHLLDEQREILTKQTFEGVTRDELHDADERLNRIRELSADYLMELTELAHGSAPKRRDG
jgi:hypothetical protein